MINEDIAKIKGHFYKHFVRLPRSSAEWEFIIVYPLVHIFSIGLLLTFLKGLGTSSTASAYMLVGAFAWNFYVLCQRGITYGVLKEIWSESAKQMMITPSTSRHFIIGNGLYGVLTALMSLVLMHLVALTFFSFNIFEAGLPLLVGLLGIIFYSIAEGLVVNSIIILKGPEYMHITWIITGIVMVLSAVYYPLELLPPQVQVVSNLLPTTHAIQAIRSGLLTNSGMENGLISVGLGLIYLILGTLVFRWAIDKSRKNGTILRL